jgi:tetratricopeptide (TPR) repeat protein
MQKQFQPATARLPWFAAGAKSCLRAQLLSVIFLLAVCVYSPAVFWQSGVPQQAEALANGALELAQQGDLAGAERELRKASKLAPSNPEVLRSLGTVLAMQKKLEESDAVFKLALKVSPDDVIVRRYLSANLWQLQRFAEAKSNLDILLKQKPDDRQARLLMGMVAENTKDYATATRMLSSVPELVKQQPESIAALARSYYHLRETRKARETLAQLSGVQPMLLGAEIADQMQDFETAERMVQSLQSQMPHDAHLAFRLALVQYHALEMDACEQTLLTAMETGPPTSQMYNLLGWCYYKRHQAKEAVDALNKAIALAPEDESNYLDLADILIAGNSLPAALAVARKATAALPNSANAFQLRGSIEQKVGQFTDAVNSYARAVRLDPVRPSLVAGLGEAQFSAGLATESILTFENAMKRFPKDARFRLSYGVVLLKQAEAGDSKANLRAEELFRAALVLVPGSPDAHYQLGKLLLDKGNVSEAIQHLEKSIRLNPNSSEAHFSLSRAYRRARRISDANHEMESYQKLKSTTTDVVPSATDSGDQPRAH